MLHSPVLRRLVLGLALLSPTFVKAEVSPARTTLSREEYRDKVHAVWMGQIIAVLLGMPYEHKVASVLPIESLPMLWHGRPATVAPVDDDWYYEMSAVRAFEKYGIGLTVEQLGDQWLADGCGSWGSSEQARLNLSRGIKASDCGHPRYNKFWFTIGPQFSADVYGALAPGMPNVAAKLAREMGHINGYAEATDGGVFVATMISLGFRESDVQRIVRDAANVIHPESPYRQCIDMVITMAEAGKTFHEVVEAVEDRWHHEYPATNNAVANGGILAAGVWFGRGEFWPTMNLIAHAADYTDADCNAANAMAVIGAMHGMKALPAALVAQLHDRIVGTGMGTVKEFLHAVDESILELSGRTAAIGEKFLQANKAELTGDQWSIPSQAVVTQPLERFRLADLMQYWNPDWSLERAGFAVTGGGLVGVGGFTMVENDVLSTYPRDEIRACYLHRKLKLSDHPQLTFEAGSEAGRAWQLLVYADNDLLEQRLIIGGNSERAWQKVSVSLEKYAGKETTLRLYQRVLVRDRVPGSALWRNLRLD